VPEKSLEQPPTAFTLERFSSREYMSVEFFEVGSQHIHFRGKVVEEGALPHICRFRDFLNRDLSESFRLDQTKRRLIDALALFCLLPFPSR
jgi:hypothetical protein